MAATKQQYIPVYSEHIKAAAELIKSGIITAADLGAAIIALTEYAESGTVPDLETGEKIVFTFMQPKVDEAKEAYAAKVEAGRNAALKQHEEKRKQEAPEESTPDEEEDEQDTQGYPREASEPKEININKNNINKKIKEKINKKEKDGGGIPRARNGTKKINENLNYSMRSDNLNDVILDL